MPIYPEVSDLTVAAVSSSRRALPVRISETAMWVFRVIKWAGILIAGVAAAAIAILLTIDVGDYRDDIAAGFKNFTGRDLSIGGEIDLSLSFIDRSSSSAWPEARAKPGPQCPTKA